MPTDKKLKNLVLNVMTEEQYDSATKNEDELYLTPDNSDEIEKVIPTDVAIKDNKLGLKHGSTWLTNQNAINLGDGLTYDEATKTLKASGGGGSGGSTLYCHYISMTKFSDTNAIGYIGFNYYNNSSNELNDLTKITSALADKFVLCSGFVKNSATNKFMNVLDITASDGNLIVELFYTIDGLVGSDIIDSTYDIMDTVFQVA